ncbi:MAG: transglycosylase SLT domain-containing protein [Bacteroidales bacterium]|jgi:hypothetical protein|nr:transglycosylase SLT domain-containing protein [Bacteroidales bacterium]
MIGKNQRKRIVRNILWIVLLGSGSCVRQRETAREEAGLYRMNTVICSQQYERLKQISVEWSDKINRRMETCGQNVILYVKRKLKKKGSSTKRTGIISQYDELFKKYSSEINWDWRLLASLVYHESSFDPSARSRAGAYGLMQMMPSTMESYGVDTAASPEKHIAAGVKYIKYLDNLMSRHIPNKNERVKFVLASYNIGPGHVLDARRLAGKYGKDATVWENNVDSCLLSKVDPKYYTDPEVRHGRCHGKETHAFVAQVMKLYGYYKTL